MDRDKLDTGKSDRLKISFRDRERGREGLTEVSLIEISSIILTEKA